MGLKKFPTWLKGGLIGLAVLFILVLLIAGTWNAHTISIFFFVLMFIAYPLIFIGQAMQLGEGIMFLGILILPCYFFCLGAAIGAGIGWIIGKLKHK